jgi:hypothetical protein
VARRSLRPQLNQIRAWVRQGRTDAWIAHQLEVTVKDIDQFKREHGLAPDEDGEGLEERDLRAEDDELVAAELDAIEDEDEEEDNGDEEEEDGEEGEKPRPRRRGRRGGRRRRAPRQRALEGTFDHGEEGYGLWLDPAIQDDPVYAEHWAGHRALTVSVEPDRIVISRAGEQADEAEGEPEPD